MPRRRRRSAALVAVIALLLATPFQRGRDCDVCPVDCPMHAARKGPDRPVGCHHGAVTAPAAHPAEDGACTMRAACGHHGESALSIFHAELPPAIVVAPHVPRQHVALADRPMHPADGPTPPKPPPQPFVV